MTHVTLVSGSHRAGSQSRKVADYLAARLGVLGAAESDIIDLAGNPLPLWDGEAANPASATGKVWADFSPRLKKADGLVIIAPEWHGMVPAGLKNFFLHTSAREVGHKPALIVTVSAARGGSYPVDELRTSGYKNSRILYLPDHVIVRHVGDVLNGAEETSKDDGFIRRRLDYAARILLAYAQALKPIRASGITENAEFPTGM